MLYPCHPLFVQILPLSALFEDNSLTSNQFDMCSYFIDAVKTGPKPEPPLEPIGLANFEDLEEIESKWEIESSTTKFERISDAAKAKYKAWYGEEAGLKSVSKTAQGASTALFATIKSAKGIYDATKTSDPKAIVGSVGGTLIAAAGFLAFFGPVGVAAGAVLAIVGGVMSVVSLFMSEQYKVQKQGLDSNAVENAVKSAFAQMNLADTLDDLFVSF